MAGCSSMFILTSFTLPLTALTVFSNTGVSCLHGPHQGAQKSTRTGWRFDSSMTSLTKVCVVVSLTDPSAVAVAACCSMFPAQRTLARTAKLVPAGRVCPIRPIKWEEKRRMQSWCLAGLRRRDRLDPWLMPRGLQEFEQPLPRSRRCPGVHQRVKVEHGMLHHGSVKHDSDAQSRVVDYREGCHRAGLDTNEVAHQVGGAKGKPPRSAEQSMQRPQLNHRVFKRYDEVHGSLFVAQKQILGVRAGNFAAHRLGLFDREQGLMADGLVRDAEAIQVGKKLVRRGGHWRFIGLGVAVAKP